jgi:DNA polymerase/3'-5' exonuclease PolX
MVVEVLRRVKGQAVLADAQSFADEIVGLLEPGCERLEVAGSIRRGAGVVGDIEIVAMPKIVVERDPSVLWADSTMERDLLVECIDHAVSVGRLAREAGAGRYEKLRHVESGLQVDVFVVRPPAEWGVILLLRTGPARFSQEFVTEVRARGMHVAKGALHEGPGHDDPGKCRCPVIATPEESDVFREVDMAEVPPEFRGVWSYRGASFRG